MAKRKRRYFIDEKQARKFMYDAYGFKTRKMNWYTIRIYHEELPECFWDWYHTQGTVVMTNDGTPARFGVYEDDEKLCVAINREAYKLLS